jgi:hypothetical protein
MKPVATLQRAATTGARYFASCRRGLSGSSGCLVRGAAVRAAKAGYVMLNHLITTEERAQI